MDRQDSQIILNEEYNRLGIYQGMPNPYMSEISGLAGAIPNIVSSPVSPAAISSGQAKGEIKQVSGVWYANKTSFSDTTAGYRFGIDSDGIAKFYFGDASGYVKWDGTTFTIAGITGFIATGGAASDVNTYGTTINGGKITTGTITADKITTSTLSAIAADLGTITAGAITGITITGGTIRTAASGKRVEMLGSTNTFTSYDSAGTKRMDLDSEVLAFYNSSGTAIGSIYADAATSNLLISTNPTNSSIYISGKGTGVVSLSIGTDNYFYLSGTNTSIVSAKNFVSVGTVSIGESSNPWSDIYTYDLWADKLQNISGANVIDLNLSGRIATNQMFGPSSAAGASLGDATYYWNDVSYKTLTDRGCLGWFDEGVELQDGRVVSDIQALKEIKKHETKKTVYGKPMLDYKTLPKSVYKPADRKGILIERKNGEPIEGQDGAETTALISIMLGAIKELSQEVDNLKTLIKVKNVV